MHVCMYVYVRVYVYVYAHVHVRVINFFCKMVLQLRCNCNSRVSNCLTVARELYTCGIVVVWSLYSTMFICIVVLTTLLQMVLQLQESCIFFAVLVIMYSLFCNCDVIYKVNCISLWAFAVLAVYNQLQESCMNAELLLYSVVFRMLAVCTQLSYSCRRVVWSMRGNCSVSKCVSGCQSHLLQCKYICVVITRKI